MSGEPQLRKFNILPMEQARYSYHNRGAIFDSNTDVNGDLGSLARKDLDAVITQTSVQYRYSRKYSTSLKMIKPFRPSSSSRDGKVPINNVGFVSYLFLSWMTSLVLKIYRNGDKPLTKDDLWECSEWETVKVNSERLSADWQRELKNKGPKKASMLRVWLWFIRTRLVVLIGAVVFNAVITFIITGYIIEVFIAYLESDDSSLAYGFSLVAAVFVGQILRGLSFTFIFLFGQQTGIRFRAGVLGMAYQKLLKLRNLKAKEQAKAVTLFGADSIRLLTNCVTFVYLLSLPVYLTIMTVYMYYLIGLWCFISVGIFLFCYQLQAYLTILVAKLRKKTLVFTDRRLRMMTELVGSMKFIKMYAWEDYLKKNIIETRKKEQKYLLWSAVVNSMSSAVIPITPTLSSIVTIASYRAAGNEINATIVFSMVATLNFLRFVVGFLPFASRGFGEAKTSLDRLLELMIKDEYEAPPSECSDESNVIEIHKGFFTWELDSQRNDKHEKTDSKVNEDQKKGNRLSEASFQLAEVNLNIEKGELIGICGPVGCGKSSLITAILGRMPITSGNIAVSGSVAYAAQQAWIFNGTVRENILFGKPFDFAWYQEVIHVCGLEPDLAIMDSADETEIGERGINLSGGQKQRVSLARAVYSRSDIYLLDDPLSAVDIQVGKFLFYKCIQKTLKDKTVVLITHQLQYLNHCDNIFVMNNGKIVEQGHHRVLVSAGGYYSDIMKKFHFNDASEQDVRVNKKKNIKSEDGNENGEHGQLGSGINKVSYKKDEHFNAAGGACVAVLVLLSHTVASGSTVFSTWWLGIWLSSMTSSTSTSHLNTTDESSTTVSCPTNFSSNVPNLSQPMEHTVWDFYLIVYTGSIGGIVLLTFGKGIIGSVATVSASVRMHNKALERVIKAPMLFFDTNPTGRILNRFSKDLDEGDVYIPMNLDNFLSRANLTIISLIVSSLSLPWIWIAIVPACCVFFLVKSISSMSIQQLKKFENMARSPLLSHVNTSGEGLSTIVAFKQQLHFIYNFMELSDVTSTGLLLYECGMLWISIRTDIIASTVLVATCLTMVLTKGIIDPALAALSLTICLSSTVMLQYVVILTNECESRFTSLERIHEYEQNLDIESDDKVSVVPDEQWPKHGHVFFSNVEMAYRDDLTPVLKNIHFEVFPREKIGIVGRTGAGKSSLAVALFRLVELSAGHIYVDDIDVSRVPRKALRSILSTIPQDPVLFAGTLRYNLDPTKSFTDEDIWSALEQAHVKEKVLLFEEGLELFVEENGENFSVGERQLLCLARAILRRNKILILDEATASIDTATDALIQQTIRESFSDCTVLTVAHRLNTVLHCDRIVVMDVGQVVEIGKPQDLLANPHSVFNAMISAQTVLTPTLKY